MSGRPPTGALRNLQALAILHNNPGINIIIQSMHRFIVTTAFLIANNCLGSTFEQDLVAAAIDRTKHTITYDGSYLSIPYPGGDVPNNIGVCTDVIIRSYRSLGTDLQVLVHEDMAKEFEAYPSKRIWGLSKPDKNIDHRRVPNLQAFLTRHGSVLPVTNQARDYAPGNIVTWLLPGNLPHIGIVTNNVSETTGNPLIVHNIGAGPSLDDMLFSYKITGHYRYVPNKYND
ncbi:DUF1287 domain-containing protein [Aestuariirhabdus sp. Z084]|uniref:DUF1287 domain-containing protein n=1 Tax=Aestuariirhabdus haliotis TaxID=2918751 RepID=UPI00201B3A5B|nr:DUF1287 domain-containing protein [Aestuariirhabdus haliotis]MCL6416244.1 DUF1287 domain-containing protein [Aestuariirhabdus haliotis]MCL6420296.1 DUF1287 domain-containing protein [Aestuariirhabdus haliotis]